MTTEDVNVVALGGKQSSAVIFGGAGFIGSYFARHLLDEKKYTKIYLVDRCPIPEMPNDIRYRLLGQDEFVEFVQEDVRNEIDWMPEAGTVDLIANFAAVHREPGHSNEEYFDCNLRGAKNICEFSTRVGCRTIVFTSSIAPYGVSEGQKDEETLPVPVSAYGASKLVAEAMHKEWLAGGEENRLVVVRPGVVFGAGEGGNVTRLVRAVKSNYFFYMSNKSTRKAGIYVKEVCHAICWLLERTNTSDSSYVIANLTMHPAPSMEEYVTAIQNELGKRRWIFDIPRPILFSISFLISVLAGVLSRQTPFDLVRLRKTIRSNDIRPSTLISGKYTFKYDLDSAMKDWASISPEDWK